MKFREAVEATSGLSEAYEAGLKALAAVDRSRITVANEGSLCGSVNLDTALRRGARAHEHVWDYGVCHATDGYQGIHWIEVHPASDHGVTDLLDKFAWLTQWLASDGSRLRRMTVAFIWISSGKTTFTKTSSSARRLAQKGVRSAGRHYHIK